MVDPSHDSGARESEATGETQPIPDLPILGNQGLAARKGGGGARSDQDSSLPGSSPSGALAEKGDSNPREEDALKAIDFQAVRQIAIEAGREILKHYRT